MRVRTGKRGRFVLELVEWGVYDPSAIDNDDVAIPLEPWLECFATVCRFPNEPRTWRLFVVSHHAMTRSVQRCNARAPIDLVKALAELYACVAVEVIAKNEALDERAVRYFDVAGGTAVLKYDDTHKSLVVTTVLDSTMLLTNPAGAAP